MTDNIIQEPWRRYDDAEERDSSTFTLRVNDKESKLLYDTMLKADIKFRPTAVKFLMELGYKCFLSFYPQSHLNLFKKERARFEDLSAKERRKIKDCVSKD